MVVLLWYMSPVLLADFVEVALPQLDNLNPRRPRGIPWTRRDHLSGMSRSLSWVPRVLASSLSMALAVICVSHVRTSPKIAQEIGRQRDLSASATSHPRPR
jgi:hypothetical protein